MTDLKIIDELLVDMKGPNGTFEDLENRFYVVREALARLRQAWLSKEMPIITLSLANYFKEEE